MPSGRTKWKTALRPKGVVAAPLFMGDDVLRDAGDQYSQAPGST